MWVGDDIYRPLFITWHSKVYIKRLFIVTFSSWSVSITLIYKRFWERTRHIPYSSTKGPFWLFIGHVESARGDRHEQKGSYSILHHSSDVILHFDRANPNTTKAIKSAMRAWFPSMFEDEVADEKPEDIDEMDFICSKMIERFLVGHKGEDELNNEQLHNLKVSLSHFIGAYCRTTSGNVSPSTLGGYIDGIGRFMEDKDINVNLRTEVFKHKKDGYITALDNFTKDQQAQGIHRKPYNVILEEEMEKMLEHRLTDVSRPRSYVTRTIFVIG